MDLVLRLKDKEVETLVLNFFKRPHNLSFSFYTRQLNSEMGKRDRERKKRKVRSWGFYEKRSRERKRFFEAEFSFPLSLLSLSLFYFLSLSLSLFPLFFMCAKFVLLFIFYVLFFCIDWISTAVAAALLSFSFYPKIKDFWRSNKMLVWPFVQKSKTFPASVFRTVINAIHQESKNSRKRRLKRKKKKVEKRRKEKSFLVFFLSKLLLTFYRLHFWRRVKKAAVIFGFISSSSSRVLHVQWKQQQQQHRWQQQQHRWQHGSLCWVDKTAASNGFCFPARAHFSYFSPPGGGKGRKVKRKEENFSGAAQKRKEVSKQWPHLEQQQQHWKQQQRCLPMRFWMLSSCLHGGKEI